VPESKNNMKIKLVLLSVFAILISAIIIVPSFAQKLLVDNNPRNDGGTCGKLGAYINEVNAKKSLTQDQKNLLIGRTNTIETVIGC